MRLTLASSSLLAVVVVVALLAPAAAAQDPTRVFPTLYDVEIESVCNKVWRVRNNNADSAVSLRWDYRPSRDHHPRFKLVVPAANATRLIVLAGASASQERVYVYESDAEEPVVVANSEQRECTQLVPVCRGRYQLTNRVDDQAFEVTWQTPIYKWREDGERARFVYAQTLGAGASLDIRTAAPHHHREKLYVWLSEDEQLLRLEHAVQSRHARLCREASVAARYVLADPATLPASAPQWWTVEVSYSSALGDDWYVTFDGVPGYALSVGSAGDGVVSAPLERIASTIGSSTPEVTVRLFDAAGVQQASAVLAPLPHVPADVAFSSEDAPQFPASALFDDDWSTAWLAVAPSESVSDEGAFAGQLFSTPRRIVSFAFGRNAPDADPATAFADRYMASYRLEVTRYAPQSPTTPASEWETVWAADYDSTFPTYLPSHRHHYTLPHGPVVVSAVRLVVDEYYDEPPAAAPHYDPEIAVVPVTRRRRRKRSPATAVLVSELQLYDMNNLDVCRAIAVEWTMDAANVAPPPGNSEPAALDTRSTAARHALLRNLGPSTDHADVVAATVAEGLHLQGARFGQFIDVTSAAAGVLSSSQSPSNPSVLSVFFKADNDDLSTVRAQPQRTLISTGIYNERTVSSLSSDVTRPAAGRAIDVFVCGNSSSASASHFCAGQTSGTIGIAALTVGNEVCVDQRENTQATIACASAGDVIRDIEFASFGTPIGDCSADSRPMASSSSHSANTRQLLRNECLGRATCTVAVDESVLGSPAGGTDGARRLLVRANCGAPLQTSDIKFSSSAALATDNEWHQVALSIDQSVSGQESYQLWVDGVEDAAAPIVLASRDGIAECGVRSFNWPVYLGRSVLEADVAPTAGEHKAFGYTVGTFDDAHLVRGTLQGAGILASPGDAITAWTIAALFDDGKLGAQVCTRAEDGAAADADSDTVRDEADVCNGNNDLDDANDNGIPDMCESTDGTDCDTDGIEDSCAIALRSVDDCDSNDEIDACQITTTPALDCNHNSVLDTCEAAANDRNYFGLSTTLPFPAAATNAWDGCTYTGDLGAWYNQVTNVNGSAGVDEAPAGVTFSAPAAGSDSSLAFSSTGASTTASDAVQLSPAASISALALGDATWVAVTRFTSGGQRARTVSSLTTTPDNFAMGFLDGERGGRTNSQTLDASSFGTVDDDAWEVHVLSSSSGDFEFSVCNVSGVFELGSFTDGSSSALPTTSGVWAQALDTGASDFELRWFAEYAIPMSNTQVSSTCSQLNSLLSLW